MPNEPLLEADLAPIHCNKFFVAPKIQLRAFCPVFGIPVFLEETAGRSARSQLMTVHLGEGSHSICKRRFRDAPWKLPVDPALALLKPAAELQWVLVIPIAMWQETASILRWAGRAWYKHVQYLSTSICMKNIAMFQCLRFLWHALRVSFFQPPALWSGCTFFTTLIGETSCTGRTTLRMGPDDSLL